ncbi:ABC transporter permease DevC [Prochlorothrix hollandica]|nr:ABC transporter permease DevC [Prochlorothrix hollandica]
MIAKVGLMGGIGQSILGLKRRTPLGWLQLRRDKSRLAVAVAGIAFADILIFAQLGFRGALYDSNTAFIKSLNTDIVLVSPNAKNSQNFATFSRRRLYQALDVPGVASAHPLYSRILNWRNPQTQQDTAVQLIGFDPSVPLLNLPELNSQLDILKQPQAVLFDRGARGQYDQMIATLDQGIEVKTESEGKTLKIKGLFKLGASFGTDGFLAASDQTFSLLFPRRSLGSVSLGLLKLEPGADGEAIAQTLEQYLPEDVAVYTQQAFIEKEQAYWARESPIGFVFGLGATMAFVVGVVIVYQVLSTDVNSHIREYATFKAMGYSHLYLLGIIIEESIILAVFGFIPGLFCSMGLYNLAAAATTLPMALKADRAVFVLVLTLIMCLLSGAIATRQLQEADPADLF